jgi:hypothetical protein
MNEYEANGTPFHRQDLAPGLRKPRPRPRTFDQLLYPGKLHSLAGEPESGKTVVVLWWLLRIMRLGHPVVLFDEETGPDQLLDLFQALGAEEQILARYLHYYPYPEVNWTSPDGITHLHKVMAEVNPVLTAFDSCATMMSAAGLRENDPADVTKLWTRTLAPLGRTFGSAVVVTDHDSKDGMSSRYARGSTAKLAAVDVGFKLAAVTAFSRDMDGALELAVTKDRPGCLYRRWKVTVTRAPLTLDWGKAPPQQPVQPGMPPGQVKLLSIVNDQPATLKELVDRLAGKYGHGLHRNTASGYLNALSDAGQIERIDQGNGVEALWALPGQAAAAEPSPEKGGLTWN